MPKTSQITFNAGELTEFMDPRVDVAKYAKGCRKVENFEIFPFGTAISRPGTKHGGEAKHDDRKCRVIPFSFSPTVNFDIEVGHEYFRFWNDETQVVAPTPAAWSTGTDYVVDDYVVESATTYRCIVAHTSGTFATDLSSSKWEALEILEVTSTYQESELFQMQFEQVQDVVYITHPDHPLRKLIRLADDNWTLSTVNWSDDFNYPPMASKNFTDTTITPSAPTGTGVTLTASTNLFTADMVGEFMTICHSREDTQLTVEVSVVETSASIYVLGDWVFQTQGSGKYSVRFEESEDGGTTWTTKRQYDIDGERNNILSTGSEQSPKYFRINITSVPASAGLNEARAIIEVADPRVVGLAKITGYTSPTVATATILEDLHSTDATTDWSEEFFSKKRGYPRAICLHRNRLCLGSTDVFLSQPGNYENFRTRNDADSAFIAPVRRSGSPLIQWLEDLRELRIGTTQAEAVIVPENENEVFSYSNYRVRWDSNYGSKHLRAESMNGTALFLQLQGRTLRFQTLTGIEEYYDANTLTILADHILGEGVVQSGYQRQRYPTYHGVREDGQLSSLLYDETQNIQAWYRSKTDGNIESISVTPRPDEEDHVTYVVKRTVNGTTKRHIEFRANGQYRAMQNSDIKNLWFVDDGIMVTGTDMTTVSGLGHLEGETVAILADGAAMTERVVSGGSIDLDYKCDKVIIGRPYDMTLTPMFLESQGVMGQAKNISGAIVRLWRSGRAEVRVDGEKQWTRMSQPPEFLDTAPDLYTGDTEKLHLTTDWSRNSTVEIKGRSPLPLGVQAITLEFEIGRG